MFLFCLFEYCLFFFFLTDMVFTATTPTTNPSAKNAVTTKSGQHQISSQNNSNVTLPKFL
jgi:hypothetical protein